MTAPHPRINPRRFWAVALLTALVDGTLVGTVGSTLGAIAGIIAVGVAIALSVIIAKGTASWILELPPVQAPQWTEDQL